MSAVYRDWHDLVFVDWTLLSVSVLCFKLVHAGSWCQTFPETGFGLVLQTGPWVSLVCSGDMAGLVHSLRIGPCLSALPRV